MADAAALQAYRLLEADIVTLELAPGSLTTEGALIASTGLGRTPVREAIQRLAWEGLLEVRPRAGLAIAPLLPGDWPRVIDARRGVEELLARSAARHARPSDLAGFRGAALAMDEADKKSDARAFLLADKQMDEALAQACNNPFAARLAAPLQSHSRRFWFRFRGETGLNESVRGHAEIISAILERDEEGAAAAANRLMAMLRGHAETEARR